MINHTPEDNGTPTRSPLLPDDLHTPPYRFLLPESMLCLRCLVGYSLSLLYLIYVDIYFDSIDLINSIETLFPV